MRVVLPLLLAVVGAGLTTTRAHAQVPADPGPPPLLGGVTPNPNPDPDPGAAPAPMPARPAPTSPRGPAELPPTGDVPLVDLDAEPAPPGSMPRPIGSDQPGDDMAAPAKLDPDVLPVQQPAPGAAPAGGAPMAVTPFAVDPSILPLGAQAVGLSVQVFAPQTMNLNKQSTVTVIVKNTGSSDALGVVVRDELPAGSKYVKSLPEAASAPAAGQPGGLVVWNLDTLPAGVEKQLKVVIEPVVKGPQEHMATVTLASGSRAKTVVRQPLLRIEMTVSPSRVLKGEQVQYDFTIINDGDGPARNVELHGELSSGLKYDQGNILEYRMADDGKPELAPNETMRLKPLIVAATGIGEQTFTVKLTSPDIAGDPPTASKTVEIVAPVIQLTLSGPQKRYTDTMGEYTLKIENVGTAPAADVRLSAGLVGDVQPYKAAGSTWDSATRRHLWSFSMLEPGKSQEQTFRLRYGGLGVVQINAEVLARGGLKEVKSLSTSIDGNALVELIVTEDLRVLDVNQVTDFKIRLRNTGTKEATNIQVNADLTANLTAVQTAGTDLNASADPTGTKIVFPPLERLAPGTEVVLGIRAKAKAPGLASARVFCGHQDLQGGKIETVTNVTITDVGAGMGVGQK
jgi:uncharacterized repeat protein (TIGR01451 family)